MKRTRTYSPYALEAARLLGLQVAAARRRRRWSAQELAERADVSPVTLSKIERGDLTVGLGTAFDVAALVGVELFVDDPATLSAEVGLARERLALLPRRVRKPNERIVRDDF